MSAVLQHSLGYETVEGTHIRAKLTKPRQMWRSHVVMKHTVDHFLDNLFDVLHFCPNGLIVIDSMHLQHDHEHQ